MGAPPRYGFALAFLLPLVAGCPAFTTMGPARTAPPGTAQQWVSLGAYRTTLVTGTPPFEERSIEWFPLVEAGVRFGLTDSVDLALRVGTGGGSFAPRIQVARSLDPDSGLDVLFEPSVGWTALVGGSHEVAASGLTAGLAFPTGVNLGKGHQIVATPRLAWMNDRFAGGAMLAGGSLALVLRVADGARGPWYIVPECGGAKVSGAEKFAGPMVQCALGLIGP